MQNIATFRDFIILGAGIVLASMALVVGPAASQGLDTDDAYRPPDFEIVPVNPLQVKDGVIGLSHSGCQLVEPEQAAHYLYITFPRDCPRELRRMTRALKKAKKKVITLSLIHI